ncbi:DMT family transporter [Leifsonia sp. fls2-241-R2A-40a]|uniref:DMT family transporter n=1 Tax=Leifsonia sp. fls2-241-R2A-40a TaxID=3040290 RepID=UPI00254BEA78|nr:DMT family transporter [Leifsonia sp. fls2-241-R2A-40a]
MSPVALLLVIAAAFCHAAWNLASKRASASGIPFIFLGAVASTLLWLPAAGVDIAVGGAARDVRALLLGAGVSAIIHVGYMWVLQRGYRHGDISVVYPMARGTGPLLSVVFAILLFGEHPTALALAGAAVVVAGIVGIGLSTGRPAPGSRLIGPGILYGLLTGVTIATYTLWDAFTVNDLGVTPVSFMVGCSLGEVLMLAPVAYARRAEVAAVWRAHSRQVWVVGVLSPLSYILVLTAITMAPVSLVAPARELSVVLVSLAGWLILREPRPAQRLAGAVVVLGGVAMLALS